MTSDSQFLSHDLGAQPDATEPKVGANAHFIVSVTWITYWMTNSYVWIGDVAPFLNYYVMTAFFIMYYALTRPTQVLRFVMHPAIWLWALTAIIPAILYISGDHRGQHAYGAMRTRIVFFSILASVGLVLWDTEGRRVLRAAATTSLIITVIVCFGELFVANPYARAIGRSSSFFADPNIAGTAILTQLLLSQDIRKQSPKSLMIVGFAVLGVVTTLSRSAMAFAALTSAVYLFLPQGPGTLPMATRILMAFSGILLIPIAVIGSAAVFDIDTRESWRLQSILTFDTDDRSSQQRLQRAIFAFERFAEFFWTGRGPGASAYYSVHSHNTYLTIAYDYGIFAVIIYILLILQGYFKVLRFGLQRSLTAVALSSQIIWVSLFDHTLANQSTVAVIFAAMMTNVIISPREEIRTQPPPPQPQPGPTAVHIAPAPRP